MAKYILMVGNPGAGKSTLLNSLCGEVKFQAGISIGHGLTNVMQKERAGDGTYLLDTPGLADMEMRERAAEEITRALKQDGNYQIFFVMTVEAGRIRPGDIVTMNLVLNAAPITRYGIIINKISAPLMKKLESPQARDELLAYLFKDVKQVTNHIYFAQEVAELKDEDNVLWKMPEQLRSFIEDFPGLTVRSSDVTGVDARDYEQKLEEQEKRIRELLQDKEKMQQEVAKLHQQLAEGKERQETMAAQINALQETCREQERMVQEAQRAAAESKRQYEQLSQQLAMQETRHREEMAKLQDQVGQARRAADEAAKRAEEVEQQARKAREELEQRQAQQGATRVIIWPFFNPFVRFA